jgi:hypothetical protein
VGGGGERKPIESQKSSRRRDQQEKRRDKNSSRPFMFLELLTDTKLPPPPTMLFFPHSTSVLVAICHQQRQYRERANRGRIDCTAIVGPEGRTASRAGNHAQTVQPENLSSTSLLKKKIIITRQIQMSSITSTVDAHAALFSAYNHRTT